MDSPAILAQRWWQCTTGGLTTDCSPSPKTAKVAEAKPRRYGTLPSGFRAAMDWLPNPRAQPVGGGGVWEPIASAECLRGVAGVSMALVELGVKRGDRVGLFATNRPEWHTADFAIS